VEAAAIAWRPLGRLLVEQGLLTERELELALAKQQITGKRLGETIVECGFVSRPDLSNALAAQYGIELTTETGFGTGLRAQIQQRHESDRGVVIPIATARPVEPAVEIDAEPDDTDSPPPAEALLLAQLEEQWAKLAAAEEQIAARELELAALGTERDRRRAQAERFCFRARSSRAEHAVQRERRRVQVVRFMKRVRNRDDELERRNEELRCLDETYSGRIGEQRAALAAAEERLAEREHELAALTADRDRRRAQAVRFSRRVRARDDELRRLGEAADALRDQAKRLAGDIRGCDAEIDRLRNENGRRRAQAASFATRIGELRRSRDDDPVVTSSHLVFLQLASGYELVERDGPPPPRHSPLELPGLFDGTLAVAGSRPSPFPGDARPCVVVQLA